MSVKKLSVKKIKHVKGGGIACSTSAYSHKVNPNTGKPIASTCHGGSPD